MTAYVVDGCLSEPDAPDKPRPAGVLLQALTRLLGPPTGPGERVDPLSDEWLALHR